MINYKRLKREQDASAPTHRVPGATAGRDPMSGAGANPSSTRNALADARMGGGGGTAPLPGDGAGAGNHMAAVIRRIEGFYSAPRFDDSDEDDASRGADDEANDEEDAAEQDDSDDDFVDDGRDPNDPAVIAEREKKREAKKLQKARHPNKSGKKQPEEWYDMDDDFIDDDELDEYFERTGKRTKLGGSGGDRFYVNRGDLEFVDDGTGQAQARARTGDAPREWTKEEMAALRRGVEKHGRRWRTIKRDPDFGALLSNFSDDAIKHKWKKMNPRAAPPQGGGTPGRADALSPVTNEPRPSTPQRTIDAATPGGAPGSSGGPTPPDEATLRALEGGPASGGRVANASSREFRGAASRTTAAALLSGEGGPGEITGLGRDGVWCPELAAAVDGVEEAAAGEAPPPRGSRAPLPASVVERLKRVVRVCKTWPGADPNAALPKGLLKQMMRFLEPFCSPVTLQKRMSGFAAELLAETGIGGGGRDSGGAADARRGGSGLAAPEDAPLPGF